MFSFKKIKLDLFASLNLYFITLIRSERVVKTQNQIKPQAYVNPADTRLLQSYCSFVRQRFPLFLATLLPVVVPFFALFLVVSRFSFAHFFRSSLSLVHVVLCYFSAVSVVPFLAFDLVEIFPGCSSLRLQTRAFFPVAVCLTPLNPVSWNLNLLLIVDITRDRYIELVYFSRVFNCTLAE